MIVIITTLDGIINVTCLKGKNILDRANLSRM